MAEATSTQTGDEEVEEYPMRLKVTLIRTSITFANFLFSLELADLSTATASTTTEFNSLVDVGW